MAYCSKCGKKVKESEKFCPSCGNKVKEENNTQSINNNLHTKKKQPSGCLITIFIFLGFIILIGIIASIAGVDTDSSNSSSSEDTIPKYDTSKTYSIGEKLVCPNFDITIDSVQIKPNGTYIDSYQYISDPEWIGIILTVKNTSSDTKTFSTSKVKLTNSNGEIIRHSTIVYNIWGVELLNSPELISGGTKTGYIQFNNPSTDNSNLTLTIDCTSGLFDETVKYNVNISQ